MHKNIFITGHHPVKIIAQQAIMQEGILIQFSEYKITIAFLFET